MGAVIDTSHRDTQGAKLDIWDDGVVHWFVCDFGCHAVLGVSVATLGRSHRGTACICSDLHGVNQSHLDSCAFPDGEPWVSAKGVFLEGSGAEHGVEFVDPGFDAFMLSALGD